MLTGPTLELLELRLRELNETVDRFVRPWGRGVGYGSPAYKLEPLNDIGQVVVEGRRTEGGTIKPLFFEGSAAEPRALPVPCPWPPPSVRSPPPRQSSTLTLRGPY